MRNLRFVISLALACAAPPALAAPRILEVQGQVQDPAQQQVQEKAQEQGNAPAQEQAPAPAQEKAPAQPQGEPQVPAAAPERPNEQAAEPAKPPGQRPPVRAQYPTEQETTAPSRFSFRRVDDGILRLDSTSGQIAFCSSHTVGWTCQAVPEDRAALEKEIGRLQGEVSDLQNKIAGLQAEIANLRAVPPVPPRPPADVTPPADKAPPADKGGALGMPTEADMARARAVITDVWRRLMEMIANLQRDMMRKTAPSDRTTL